MFVYDSTPTGLAPDHLAAAARREPSAARAAAARAVGGVALVALAFVAPFGWLCAVGGVALIGSTLLFARTSATLAVKTPALVFDGRPAWEGTKRSLFAIRADHVDDVAQLLAAGLDRECGAGLTAFDDDELTGVARSLAFADAERPALLAWGVGRPAALRATGDTSGIWLRRRPPAGAGSAVVEVLADRGAAEAALRLVAQSV